MVRKYPSVVEATWGAALNSGKDMSNPIKVGDFFGRWEVVGDSSSRNLFGKKFYPCRCECGVEREVNGVRLKAGRSRSCGCIAANKSLKVGDCFGRWEVTGPGFRRAGSTLYPCRCECGTERDVGGTSMKRGHSRSCGCIAGKPIKVGDFFGRWEVIEVDVYRDRWNNAQHRCRCECGTEKPVFENSLRSAMSWSCGCIQKKPGFNRHHPLYGIWSGIFTRCENENYPQFDLYGGRGIKVCDRWRDFSNFAADMGDRPGPNHSVEREDNDGDYEPGNCRWATPSEQARNRSSNRLLGYQGRVQCLQDWCDELGLDYKLMHGRLMAGWTVDRAFETPHIRK